MKTITELRSECGSDEQFGQAILEKVKILTEENPDYVYKPNVVEENESYSYVCGADGSKGCIIGQALQMLGVRLEDKKYGDKRFSVILEEIGVSRTTSTSMLSDIQVRQDSGRRWGELCTNWDRL